MLSTASPQTQHLLYVFITPYPNVSLVKYYSGLVATLLKNFPSSTSPLSSFPFPYPPFSHPPRGWGSLERGRFHHLVLPGSIPALACPLRDLFCSSTDDDPGSTPPLPTEHINHLHSSRFWGREGGLCGGGGAGEAFDSTSLIWCAGKREIKVETEVWVPQPSPLLLWCLPALAGCREKSPRRHFMTHRRGGGGGGGWRVSVCLLWISYVT